MRKSKPLALIILALPLIGLALPEIAHAERRSPLAGQPAIRRRIELRKMRFEIAPQFLVGLNQDYRHAFGPGGKLEFHIFDWLGVGLEGAYMFNTNTALEDAVRGQLPTEAQQPYQYPGPQPTREIHDQHVLSINAVMSAFVSITPFSGKFAMFSSAFANYDFYITGGVGFVNYTQDGCCSRVEVHPAPGTNETLGDPNLDDASIFAGFKVGGEFGIGAHLFFNDWVGIQLDLKDYIVGANPGGGDVNGDRRLTSDDEGPQNNLFFGAALSFLLPPKAKISR